MTTHNRLGASIALGLLVLMATVLSQVKTTARSSILASTRTPSATPSPTLDPSAFNLLTATVYQSTDKVIDILLPSAWKASPPTTPGRYSFSFGSDQYPIIVLQVQITTPAELIPAAPSPANAKDTMKAILDSFASQLQSGQLPPTTTMTNIAPVKIGNLKGVGFILNVPDNASQPGAVLDLRIADLPGGKILFTYSQCSKAAWLRAKPVLDRMIESLVIHPEVIPSATPTSTPIALELTATSLQSQLSTIEAKLQALTPTETPLPISHQ